MTTPETLFTHKSKTPIPCTRCGDSITENQYITESGLCLVCAHQTKPDQSARVAELEATIQTEYRARKDEEKTVRALNAELSRLRPVVTAAKAWRQSKSYRNRMALIFAIDALTPSNPPAASDSLHAYPGRFPSGCRTSGEAAPRPALPVDEAAMREIFQAGWNSRSPVFRDGSTQALADFIATKKGVQ